MSSTEISCVIGVSCLVTLTELRVWWQLRGVGEGERRPRVKVAVGERARGGRRAWGRREGIERVFFLSRAAEGRIQLGTL